MKPGDLVIRKSYGGDVVFRICAVENGRAVLKGVEFRLLADAPLEDLEPCRAVPSLRPRRDPWGRPEDVVPEAKPLCFGMPGKVLHLDGDLEYLRKSMVFYREFRVPVHGYFVREPWMAEALVRLLPAIHPDIVVVTGHDGLLKRRPSSVHDLTQYKNSAHFVRAVDVARRYERNPDELIIVAGACQSHFEALLHAGANFASSPARVLIHALDPVSVAVRAAYTPIGRTIDLPETIRHTISGVNGIGGIDTRGRYREGMPKLPVHLQPLLTGPSASPGDGNWRVFSRRVVDIVPLR